MYRLRQLFTRFRRLAITPHASAQVRVRGTVLGNGHLQFGVNRADSFATQSTLIVRPDAELHLDGKFRIFSGANVAIAPKAILRLGNGYANNNFFLSCGLEIEIGDGAAIGPFVRLMDSDWHEISDAKGPSAAPIRIGKHVWIGMGALS